MENNSAGILEKLELCNEMLKTTDKYMEKLESAKSCTHFSVASRNNGRLAAIAAMDKFVSNATPMKVARRNAYKLDHSGKHELPFTVPVCPVCGTDIVNHGKGWICPNAECRQAIDQESVGVK